MVSSNTKAVKILVSWGVYDQFAVENKTRYKREERKFEKILELKEEEKEEMIDEEKKFKLKWKIRKNNEIF